MDWAPCSDRSRLRGDPLGGTGGFGQRWLLVEIDGSWGEHAFMESALDPELGRAVVRRAEKAGMRPVAIRAFGKRATERRGQNVWRWAIADSRPGQEAISWGAVNDPEELLQIPLDGSAGEPSEDPAILVCTHARHDRCCAVRGRPVAAALSAEYPQYTWECSHLGGDRFAATMIVLPHGLYYGRVPADQAHTILQRFAAGEVVPEYFRGRSSLTNVTQAAQAYARDHYGDTSITAWAPISEDYEPEAGRWVVRLQAQGGIVDVRMHQGWSEPLLSTCAAITPAPVRQFMLDSCEFAAQSSS